jgi:thiosulfate/3-mercaptopyruvate sulfurtransferase
MSIFRLLLSLIGGVLLIGGAPLLLASDIVDGTTVDEATRRGAIIWDVRDPKAYAEGHIPGAVNIGDAGKTLRDPNEEDYIPTATVEKIFNEAGIDLGKEVIVYGETGDPYAHWGLITIRYFGGKNGKVYHGGIGDWKAAKRPVSTESTKLPAAAQTLTVQPDVLVFTPQVREQLDNPNVQIVDVRSAKEYSGDDIRALRGGHIPGARNVAYEKNWVDPETAKKLKTKEVKTREGAALQPEEALKALYSDLDPSKETIVYCQSGVRASETANVLRSLGFENVKVYEESWLGYGNTLDAPAESVKFVNVGALQGRIAKLESAVEALTEQLKTATKAAQ